MQRSHDWVEQLHTFLLARADTPYSSPDNDCATFAADAIETMTGTDTMADLRGYFSEEEAMQRIATVTGGTTLEDAVVWIAAKYGLKSRPNILLAQRGDLVLYRNGDSLACGIVHLNGRDIVSPGSFGIMRMPLTSAYRAWAV